MLASVPLPAWLLPRPGGGQRPPSIARDRQQASTPSHDRRPAALPARREQSSRVLAAVRRAAARRRDRTRRHVNGNRYGEDFREWPASDLVQRKDRKGKEGSLDTEPDGAGHRDRCLAGTASIPRDSKDAPCNCCAKRDDKCENVADWIIALPPTPDAHGGESGQLEEESDGQVGRMEAHVRLPA